MRVKRPNGRAMKKLGNCLRRHREFQKRLKLDVQDHADLPFRSERAGEDGSGEAFQQQTGIELNAGGLGVKVSEVNVSALERVMTFLRPLAGIAHFNDDLRTLWRQMDATSFTQSAKSSGGPPSSRAGLENSRPRAPPPRATPQRRPTSPDPSGLYRRASSPIRA